MKIINLKTIIGLALVATLQLGCDPSTINAALKINPDFHGRLTGNGAPIANFNTTLCARIQFRSETGTHSKLEPLGEIHTDQQGYFTTPVGGRKKISQFILGAKKVQWLDYQIFLCAGRSSAAALFDGSYPIQKPRLESIMNGKVKKIEVNFPIAGMDFEVFKAASDAAVFPRNQDYEHSLQRRGAELKAHLSEAQKQNFARALLYTDDRSQFLAPSLSH